MTLLREVVESFIRLVKAEIAPNAVLVPPDDVQIRNAECGTRNTRMRNAEHPNAERGTPECGTRNAKYGIEWGNHDLARDAVARAVLIEAMVMPRI